MCLGNILENVLLKSCLVTLLKNYQIQMELTNEKNYR
jgi:hypothetical protein